MNKFKAFFTKVRNYIKNTAWIQPLLIVVVIFVVLFSLNPLTNAIKKGWTNLTTTNHMEKISYGEYVDLIDNSKEGDKYVIVFSQKNCDHCPKFYKSMNEYLDKTYDKKTSEFKIYNVDLSTKSNKVKIDGNKYSKYKDSTCGIVSPAKGSVSDEILAQDYIQLLDRRIQEFVKSFGENNVSELQTISDSTYTYVSTPLVIWYESGIETRISNVFETNSQIKMTSDGKKATAVSFKTFIENFDEDNINRDWTDAFDLTYNKK